MKILILTVTAGNGHNACAQAMKNKLEADYGATVEVVDLLKSFSTRTNAWIADKGYNLAVGKLLPVYNLFFNHYQKLKPQKRYSNSCQSTCLSTVGGLLAKIMEFRPDAIYCTHYDCAVALTDLRLAYKIPAKIVVANLDYVYSPFWESAIGVDRMVIPSEQFIAPCLERGYRAEQLLPYGLPVDVRFVGRGERDGIPTVLILFGGGTWGGVEKLFRAAVRALKGKRARVIVINGKNAKSFRNIERIKERCGVPVENVGYTDNLPGYFARADVVINKCGGGNAAEMLAAGLPMLIWERLPAQEKYNLRYLKENGAARSFKRPKSLGRELLSLLDDGAAREEMAERARGLARSGTEKTAELLLSVPSADWTGFEGDPDIKKACKRALSKMDRAQRGAKE